jgi:hypothetical protein
MKSMNYIKYPNLLNILTPIFFLMSMVLASSCTTFNHFNFKNPVKPEPDINVSATQSQNPEDILKIFGLIEIDPDNPGELPYRAVNYRIQLLYPPNPPNSPDTKLTKTTNLVRLDQRKPQIVPQTDPQILPRQSELTELANPQSQFVAETRTNSNGEFFFKVEKDRRYFIKIISNQNRYFSKIHGPFMAGDAISIKSLPEGRGQSKNE